MNTNLIEWRAQPDRRPAVIQMVPVMAKEFRRHYLVLAGIFAVIALAALVFAMRIPKAYTSSTTLLVEETNIIEPLLKGRTVPTTVVDRAAIAKEVAFSREVMADILRVGGWLESKPDALQRERLINQITSRTEITNPRQNLKLIQISYSDGDPERAYRVTRRFGELIIQESLRTKERESRAAYRFIDSQVVEYRKKLNDAEKALSAFKRAHPDVLLGNEDDIAKRIADLRMQVDRSMMDMADQGSQAGAWRSHLSRESSSGGSAQSVALRSRLADLMAERDTLRGQYTDRHPDVVRVQNQISSLQAQLRSPDRASSIPALSAAADPRYSEVRSRLTEARSRSSASASRVRMGNTLMQQELSRLNRVAATTSEMGNLTRDYELNRNLYQDLLERRENARLSMNLDAQRGGLNFRVQEPAALPLEANGMGARQFAMGGLLLAAIAPFVALLAWLRFDPRVRSAAQVEQLAGLPVLGSIPAGRSTRRRGRGPGYRLLHTALASGGPAAPPPS